MAQRKDSPDSQGDGDRNSAAKGGGKGAASGVRANPARNATLAQEKASPSGRNRGETSRADRS